MEGILHRKLGELVLEQPQLATVMRNLDLDFCCNGARTVAEACEEQQLQIHEVEQLLEQHLRENEILHAEVDLAAMTLTELTEHLENTHHKYLKREMPLMFEYAQKVADKHASSEPNLLELKDVLMKLFNELSLHLNKEEQILFPYIRDLEKEAKGEGFAQACFHSVEQPINVMEAEHDGAGEMLAHIRSLTKDFQAPAEACVTWNLLYKDLQNFEADMHMHIAKENSLLHPRATKLEQKLRTERAECT